ncbi:MAG: cysteine hydrolase family protein [Candidatus Hadarchaeaceae archaeon]
MGIIFEGGVNRYKTSDFGAKKFGFGGAVEIVQVRQQPTATRGGGIGMIHGCDAHALGDPKPCLGSECVMVGIKGSDLVPELNPINEGSVIFKRAHNIFQAAGLKRLLRKKGIGDLVLTVGVTEICVQRSAAGAFNGYGVSIAEDYLDSDKSDKGCALRYMRRIHGSQITNFREMVKRWGK